MRNFPIETALALLTLAAMLSGTHLLLPAIHGPAPTQFASIVDFPPDRTLLSPLVRHLEPTPPAPAPTLKRGAPSALLDDASPALDHFYASLWRTEKKTARRRYPHCPLWRLAQYRGPCHRRHPLHPAEPLRRRRPRLRPHRQALGLVSARRSAAFRVRLGHQPRQFRRVARWTVRTRRRLVHRRGRASSQIVYSSAGHTHFEVWYLKQPGGGSLSVTGRRRNSRRGRYRADDESSRRRRFEASAGVRTSGTERVRPPVRVFGVVAEKSGPGVVYDTLGLNGASISVLSHLMNGKHWPTNCASAIPTW